MNGNWPSDDAETGFVLDVLKQGLHKRRPVDGTLVHHWSRGGQYVSIKYSGRLAEAGIEPLVGSVGDRYDSVLAETISGLYKTEVIRCRSALTRRGSRSVVPVCDDLQVRMSGPGLMSDAIFALNAGWSSIRFERFEESDGSRLSLMSKGWIKGISTGPHFTIQGADGSVAGRHVLAGSRRGHDAILSAVCWRLWV